MTSNGDSLDDIAAVTPKPAVKIAGALSIGSGLIALVLALQAGTLLGVRGAYWLVEPLFGLAGALCVVGGYRLARMRGGSALWSACATALVLVTALGWFIVTFFAGVFVLLALALVPLSAIATIASFASIKPVEHAAAARRRLREQGLDSGL